jgi:hypothetical protein
LSLSSAFAFNDNISNSNANTISVNPSCYSSLLFSFDNIKFDVLKNVSSGG